MKHLKSQTLTEIKIDLDKNDTNVKKMESKVFRTTITTLLESLNCTSKLSREVQFLREELKEKSVLLQLLIITTNKQRNKSSDKTPKNLTPTFPSNEHNDTKEHATLINGDVIDFSINDIAIKKDTTEKNSFTKRSV